jgi:phosphatidate cytidylyltransferase
MDKTNLKKRIVSGAIYGILAILCIYLHKWSTLFLFIFFAFLTLHEYIKVIRLIKEAKTLPFLLYLLLSFFISLSIFDIHIISDNSIPLLFFWCMILIFISVLLFTKREWLNRWVTFYFGVFYISIAFYSAIKIRFYGDAVGSGGWPLLFLMFIIWLSDTMAYFGGSLYGKTPLLPDVSPKKTMEGTLTGILFAGLFGYFASGYMIGKPELYGGFMAVILSAFSTTGDLFQSHIKRLAGIKDSGNIMPGHGGAWDRLDSFLFVMPIGYLFLELI